MALSFFSEVEAPRDFRVSSSDCDTHYTKCLLCYTVKRNFYCQECIKSGAFVHSSMPYSDRFADKQSKLLRLKVNRKHILDRCEKLLSGKIKKDNLLTEAKQSRDRLDLIRLAIEQRRNNIDEKKKELAALVQHNNDLSLKLPRYQKRVSALGKHAQEQSMELQNRISTYNEQTDLLAALRRSRIRQLTKYIFPVYISYDTSDSIEDLEFVGEDEIEEPPRRSKLHIGAPWIYTDGDFSQIANWLSENNEVSGPGEAPSRAQGALAALGLAAQLTALLAWALDVRLPYCIALSELSCWRGRASGVCRAARRLSAASAALCVRAGLGDVPARPLHALHALPAAAHAHHPALGRSLPHHPALGRVEAWPEEWAGPEAAAWAADADDADDEPPEHLHWPDAAPQMEELSVTPPAPSLVTSAASSLASLWRGWTK